MDTTFQTLTQKTISSKDICYILLKNNVLSLYNSVPAYEMDICGKKIIDWTRSALDGNEVIEVDYTLQDNVFDLVLKHAKNKSVVCVLYADTPLLTKVVLQDLWNIYTSNGGGVCKLPRGYMIELQSLKKGMSIMDIQKIGEGFAKEFFAVTNLYAYNEVQNIMRDRIVAYHMENGVIFRDSKTVYIDADVEIGEGTIIFPNNYIYDQSEIGKGCVILPNNTIIRSKIGNYCKLNGAYIEQSKIESNAEINAYTRLINVTQG